jgi:hypothetical protein
MVDGRWFEGTKLVPEARACSRPPASLAPAGLRARSLHPVFTLGGDVVGVRQLATKSANPGIATVTCSVVSKIVISPTGTRIRCRITRRTRVR